MVNTSGKVIRLSSWFCLIVLLVSLTTQPAEGVQACGSNLNNILSLVCSNGFGTKVKRQFDPLDVYGDLEGAEDTELGFEDTLSGLDGWPFLSGLESNSVTKTRRRRLGITHECCQKPCSMSELMSYCRPGAR